MKGAVVRSKAPASTNTDDGHRDEVGGGSTIVSCITAGGAGRHMARWRFGADDDGRGDGVCQVTLSCGWCKVSLLELATLDSERRFQVRSVHATYTITPTYATRSQRPNQDTSQRACRAALYVSTALRRTIPVLTCPPCHLSPLSCQTSLSGGTPFVGEAIKASEVKHRRHGWRAMLQVRTPRHNRPYTSHVNKAPVHTPQRY